MKPLPLALLLLLIQPLRAADAPRTFEFTYRAEVRDLPAGSTVRAWLPVPSTDAQQKVAIVDRPDDARLTRERRFGNRFLYLETRAGGPLRLEARYRVTRIETRETAADPGQDDRPFLGADRKVPVGGEALRLLEGRDLPDDQLRTARLLYDLVDDHLVYRKDRPGWGNGDSDWACRSGFGNCTDFHSLFISLARARHIPAQFQIGFMLGPPGSGEVAGYHCWALVKPRGHGWIPVDISDANLHPEKREKNFGTLAPDRVTFSVGRDLVLEPPQSGEPVNFLVYPYVEVDGTVWPQEKIDKHFSYVDVPLPHSNALTDELNHQGSKAPRTAMP